MGGNDVMRAVGNVNGEISDALTGFDAHDQGAVDATLVALDGTPDKARLGGNAMVAVSLAIAQAAAASEGLALWCYLAGKGPVSLPLPEIQIFGKLTSRQIHRTNHTLRKRHSASHQLTWQPQRCQSAGGLKF